MLAVNALDYIDLVHGLVDHGLHHEVVRSVNLVFLDIFGNEGKELLSELACLSFPDSLAVLEFIHSDRIHDGHVFQRRISEYHPWLQVLLPCHVSAEVLEHGKKLLVSTAATSCRCTCHIIVVIFSLRKLPFFSEHDLIWILIELESLLCYGKKTIGFNVLVYELQDHSLMDYGAPESCGVILSCSEKFQLVVLV